MASTYWTGNESNDYWDPANWSAGTSPADFHEDNVSGTDDAPAYADASTPSSTPIESLTVGNDGTVEISARDCAATEDKPVFSVGSFQIFQTGELDITTSSAVQLGGIDEISGTINITNNQSNVFLGSSNRLAGDGTLNLYSSTFGSAANEVKIDDAMTVTMTGLSSIYTGFLASGASLAFDPTETETVFLDANDTTVNTAYTNLSANSQFGIAANSGATPISAAYSQNTNGTWSLVVQETGNHTLTLNNISFTAGYTPGAISISQDRSGDYVLGQGVSSFTTYWNGNSNSDFYNSANWNNDSSPLNYHGVNITGSDDSFAYAAASQASTGTISSVSVGDQAELVITAHACNSSESAPVFTANSFETQESGMIAVETDSAVQLGGINENGGTLYIQNNRGNVFFGSDNRLTGNGSVFLQDATLGSKTHNIQIDNSMAVVLSGKSSVYSGFLATGNSVTFDPNSHQNYFLDANDTTVNTVFSQVSANSVFGITAETGATPLSASYDANSNGSYSLVVQESGHHTLTLSNIHPASNVTLTPGALAITKDSAGNYLLSASATGAHAASFNIPTMSSDAQTAMWSASSLSTHDNNAMAALPLSSTTDHSAMALANDPNAAKLTA